LTCSSSKIVAQASMKDSIQLSLSNPTDDAIYLYNVSVIYPNCTSIAELLVASHNDTILHFDCLNALNWRVREQIYIYINYTYNPSGSSSQYAKHLTGSFRTAVRGYN
jgi:hypothetical protein